MLHCLGVFTYLFSQHSRSPVAARSASLEAGGVPSRRAHSELGCTSGSTCCDVWGHHRCGCCQSPSERANHVLLKTEKGTERRGQLFWPCDASEDPRLPCPGLPAGGAAEAPTCREQGAPQEPQQLSPAAEAGDGQPAAPDGGTHRYRARVIVLMDSGGPCHQRCSPRRSRQPQGRYRATQSVQGLQRGTRNSDR